jgi:hypothetical protein
MRLSRTSSALAALTLFAPACAKAPVAERPPELAPVHAMSTMTRPTAQPSAAPKTMTRATAAPRPYATTGNGISYNGGPVMSNGINIYFIWYGNWSNNSAINILTDWAENIGGSPYFNMNTTYADGNGNAVKNSINYKGAAYDNYSQGGSLGDGSALYNIVAGAINNGLPLDDNGVYFVLTSADVAVSNFCSSVCGWHSYFDIHSTRIKYAFVGNAEQCGGSCGGLGNTPNGNAGADDMASIMTHELEETATDPEINAWGDGNGENGDKCAWTFGATYTSTNGATANLQLGDRDYLIQQDWVNDGGGYCGINYTSPTVYNLVNRNSGKLLAVYGGAPNDGTAIIQWTANGTASQTWRLIADGSHFLVVNTGSGEALDVPGFSTTRGVQLDQWSVNHGSNQGWQFKSAGDYYTLISSSSGMLVDAQYASLNDGAPIIQWPANGGANQQWQLQAVSQ